MTQSGFVFLTHGHKTDGIHYLVYSAKLRPKLRLMHHCDFFFPDKPENHVAILKLK